MDFSTRPLGRNLSPDTAHIDQYPLRSLALPVPKVVEIVLPDPGDEMRKFMDQGNIGSCVGWSLSWLMSFTHPEKTGVMSRYDALWLYNQAQIGDGDPSTPPNEGTTVRAGCDVLRTIGAMPMLDGKDEGVDPNGGIAANRWATTIDDVRTGWSLGIPVSFGINWMSNFDTPVEKDGEHWIGEGHLGSIRGGHAIVSSGCSDKRQAIRLTNSWGLAYPDVWIPYKTVEKLLKENAEAVLITER